MAFETTLLATAVLGFLAAGVYAYVGRLMAHRTVRDPDNRLAMRMFATWWFALAVYTLITVVPAGFAAFGVTDAALQATLAYVGIVPLVLCLWGLLYYLVFIFTGNPRFFLYLGIAHLGMFFFLTWLVAYLDPVGVNVDAWTVTVEYAAPLTGGLLVATLLLILAPVLLAAIAYGTLFFRTRDRTSRYRIAMVAGAFVCWFGASVVVSIAGWGDAYWWPIISRGIGVAASFMVLAAYRPPRFIADTLRIEVIETDLRATR